MIRFLRSRYLEQGTILHTLILSVVILILSGLLAWKATTMLHPEILLFLCGLFMIIMVGAGQGSLSNGVLAVIIAALVVRFTLPTGTYSRIPMSLVISVGVVLWWIIHGLTVEKKFKLTPIMVSVPLIGFIGASLISYLWGNIFRDPTVQTWSSWPFVQLGALSVMLLLPALYMITANQYQETNWIAWLVGIILIGGTLALGAQLLNIQSLRFLQVRPLFPTWFICLALSLGLFHSRMSPVIRAILIGLASLWFYSVFVMQFRWLSSWLPALIACVFIAASRSKRLVLIIIIILAAYIVINFTTLQTEMSSEWDGSTVTRLDAWAHNWRVTKEHWLFGVGPAGYAAYYMTYFPDEAMATHSTYLDILSQTGVVGFISFIGFFISLGVILWRLWKKMRGKGGFFEAFSVAVFGGYFGTIVAMVLGDWIVPFVYTQTIAGFDYASYTWVMLGAAVALFQSKST